MLKRMWVVATIASLSVANIASAASAVRCTQDQKGNWINCGPLISVAATDEKGTPLNMSGFDPMSALRGGGKSWDIGGYGWQSNEFGLTLSLGTNIDPFIAYGLAITNFTTSALNFTFTFLTPYVSGPYGLITSSHSASYTRSGTTNAMITPFGGTMIHRPNVDGVDVTGAFIATGCGVVTPPFSGTCSYTDVIDLPYTTAASGMFGVTVGFTMPANTSRLVYTANGLVELEPATVPEPGTLLLLAFGVIALSVLVLQRRRAA